ncbi:hypothetical protein ANANG_G00260340 [Anguilla anguilla]|uniref:Uncharacterized protein n=1 Tax=Anguilla anguilla TaxID=7936 RepID=A0A9D3LSG3_ANGAN|nr:hypothetical protein ANANG_G00260340 [Anguilla anguilla]
MCNANLKMLVARYSQAFPTMDAREESNSVTPDDNNGVTEDDTQWKALICRTLDRKHVNRLIDHSDASFSKEFSSQLHVESGWEEAVQGWSRCAPMFCLFQLQKKCKKARTGDNDYHCLLCIDVKLSQNAEPDFAASSESSEANCCLAEARENKGIAVPTKYQRRPSTSPSAICCPNTELHGHKAREKATSQAEFGDKMTNAFEETMSRLATNVPEQRPLDKGKEVMENLIVFPPAHFPWRTVGLTVRSMGTCSLTTTDSLTAENGSYGIPATVEMCDEGEEAIPASRMDMKISEDNYGRLTPKYRSCHSSKNLLSAFSIGIPRRYVTSSDALPHAASLLGRKAKYDNQHRIPTKSRQGHRTTQTEPCLPVLLGTRVPILSASHRILYPTV